MRRPKINVIIGKKQILIAGLTIVLGAAIYVNYVFAGAKPDLAATAGSNTDGGGNYGDAEFVSSSVQVEKDSKAESLSNYFAQARLSKQESRDEAKEFLKSMMSGGDITGSEVQAISQDATTLSKYIESESKVETTLKALGFEEIICYLSDKGANIIVKTDGLSPSDAAKIKETLLSEVYIPAENITIVEIK